VLLLNVFDDEIGANYNINKKPPEGGHSAETETIFILGDDLQRDTR
jgi:hypothetical protein